VYRFHVAPGLRVLEIGCAQGDLLAALKPAGGIGVDFSFEMIERARKYHPELSFILADAHKLGLDDSGEQKYFDVIILSDLLNDLWDVQTVLEQVLKYCKSDTRIIINNYSRLWEIPLGIAKHLRLAKPTLSQNWLQTNDVFNLLDLADFEVIRC
jgi:ubiquinone/menaquinone biosynthesis C-methylase UbiE